MFSGGSPRRVGRGKRVSERSSPIPVSGGDTGLDDGSDNSGTSIERSFDYYLSFDGKFFERFPRPVSQFKFGKWKIDRAFPDCKVAVELNGGAGGGFGRPVFCQNCGSIVRARKKSGELGRPIRLPYPSHAGAGAESDAEKYNALVLAGWKVLVFTSAQLASDPAGVVKQVAAALEMSCRSGNAGDPGYTGAGVASISDPDELTDREREILEMLAEGKTAASIAFQLGISSRTVELHIRRVREKLGVSAATAAVAVAIRRGIISIRPS